jgi:hypothetical protein
MSFAVRTGRRPGAARDVRRAYESLYQRVRGLRERCTLWLLSLVECCMFSVLPRGPLRRRMRDRIDAALRQRPATPPADQRL